MGQNSHSKGWMNPVNSRARIVGGRKSQKGWWPWQIGLHKVGKMYEMTSFSIIKHQEGGGTFLILFLQVF